MAKLEPGHVYDWAAKAAERIDDEYPRCRRTDRPSVARVAAVIETFAKPMLDVLRDARRTHFHDARMNEYDLTSGCCPQCTCLDGEHPNNYGVPCSCGADAWNARIDAALVGR